MAFEILRLPNHSQMPLIFIGEWQITARAIRTLLNKSDALCNTIEENLTSLDQLDEERSPFLTSTAHFKINVCELPVEDTGVVYMFQNIAYPNKFIIEEGFNIRRELAAMNSSSRRSSQLHLRPWQVVAFFYL